MSSLEIAKLTGKLHKNVLGDIERVLSDCGIDWAGFLAQHKDASGKTNRCFDPSKLKCDLVISGYMAKYKLATIDLEKE